VDDATTDPGAEPSHGRAGRDLWAAIGVGLFLGVGLVLVPMLFLPWVFSVIVAVALMIGCYELEQAFRARGVNLVRWPLAIGTPAVVILAYFYGITAMLTAFAATALLAFAVRLLGPIEGYVADVTATVFALSYVALMGGFVSMTLAAPLGPQRVITFVVLTICSDIGGYAVGVLAGRHPIAPRVSPKKSWEGLVGSLLLQSVAGVLLFVYLLQAPWWQGLVTGLVMTVTATLGDFVESALKRDLGVKDLGRILPGHGGFMDRLDSLLPNAFVSWALFTWFLGS
jgi:phosphatidate cytidylyltransferase